MAWSRAQPAQSRKQRRRGKSGTARYSSITSTKRSVFGLTRPGKGRFNRSTRSLDGDDSATSQPLVAPSEYEQAHTAGGFLYSLYFLNSSYSFSTKA